MSYRRLYPATKTEILALQLDRNLHGPITHSDDVQALVDELERRARRSEAVEHILDEARSYLSRRPQ